MSINGLEANLLLFAFDEYIASDERGNVQTTERDGLTRSQLQDLRDRLFGAHEHPEESYDEQLRRAGLE